ncbi:MAG TPA: alpha/beta hydrolase [Firmicutes bacterium]|nr:alpha/beta hydrolase [Bacillota bacterium]
MVDKYYHQAGLRIHYLDWGGGKEAVLFLHGTTGNAHHWDFCARRLQGGFRVLSLDFRGHGDSSKPLSGYRKEDYLADVTALIEALDLKQVSLVGYSLGALVSIAYAAKHPDQIRCAVLVDPSIGTPPQVLAQYQRLAATAPPSFSSREDIRTYFYRKYGRSIDPDLLEEYIDTGLSPDTPKPGHWSWKHSRQAAVETFATRVEDNHLYLHHITCPTLFIRARESQMFSPKAWSALQEMGKGNFFFAEVPEADHGIMLQRPDVVADLICNFLLHVPAISR